MKMSEKKKRKVYGIVYNTCVCGDDYWANIYFKKGNEEHLDWDSTCENCVEHFKGDEE